MRLESEEEQLSARRLALLGFSYSGSSLERVGITRQMAKGLKQRNLSVPAGITSFQLTSPGVLYVPSHVPHDGSSLSENGIAHYMLLLWFTEQELWVTHHDSIKGGMHNLYIADPALQEMKQVYVRALEKQEFRWGQTVLLNLMNCLSNYLKGHQALVSNSAWPDFEQKSIFVAPHISARNARYCYNEIVKKAWNGQRRFLRGTRRVLARARAPSSMSLERCAIGSRMSFDYVAEKMF